MPARSPRNGNDWKITGKKRVKVATRNYPAWKATVLGVRGYLSKSGIGFRVVFTKWCFRPRARSKMKKGPFWPPTSCWISIVLRRGGHLGAIFSTGRRGHRGYLDTKRPVAFPCVTPCSGNGGGYLKRVKKLPPGGSLGFRAREEMAMELKLRKVCFSCFASFSLLEHRLADWISAQPRALARGCRRPDALDHLGALILFIPLWTILCHAALSRRYCFTSQKGSWLGGTVS